MLITVSKTVQGDDEIHATGCAHLKRRQHAESYNMGEAASKAAVVQEIYSDMLNENENPGVKAADWISYLRWSPCTKGLPTGA